MIKIEEKEAVDYVIKKAKGLPIFVWQVIRDLRINKKSLNLQNVKDIPQGMLNYVDRILWRVLRAKRERFPVIILLLMMTDVYKYALHIDVFNMTYVVIKEKLEKRYLTSDEVLFSELLDRITRYLYKNEEDYIYALPHDAWVDVLRGKSNGPISIDIGRVNTAYPKHKRLDILKEAVLRVRNMTRRKEELRRFIEINALDIEL